MITKELLQVGDVFVADTSWTLYGRKDKNKVTISQRNTTKNTLFSYELEAIGIHEGDKFAVIKTQMTGGGTGHGPYDVYPDGHYVTAIKVTSPKYEYKPNNIHIYFYQTGAFTCMLTEVNKVGKLNVVVTTTFENFTPLEGLTK